MTRREVLGIQIHSDDHEAAAAFYHELFHWEFRQHESFPHVRTSETGGLQTTLAPVHDLHRAGDVDLGVASEDVEADLARAVELGGQILLPRTQTPLGTTIGIIATPDGTKIVLMEMSGAEERILPE